MALSLGVVASAALIPVALPAPASATDVIGIGNSAHDNRCANEGGARAFAPTGFAAGTVSDLVAAVPVAAPANQCGGLGSPLVDVGVDNVANCSGVIGTANCVGNNFQTGGAVEGGAVSGGGSTG
ncbi:hypothetical protein [Streptomyces cyaneofuscatus]|uniref:hypothetical protein n=1 Tax=Streptomyces cyaneofuscatus TaxID=66883 RepID=UPI00366139AA